MDAEQVACAVERDGFVLIPAVFASARVEEIAAGLAGCMAAAADGSVRSQSGSVYAARNILRVFAPAATVWRQPPLPRYLRRILGPHFGLVRGLFFDKPPERTWSLPWHKDLTVAVRDNTIPSRHFSKPTRKAGVPHAEAPLSVLESMLTARMHLDDVTEENGPLKVQPGSHRDGKDLRGDGAAPVPVLCRRGDVLLMRPLVAHGSPASQPGTRLHRRILHLEFAASSELPDGYAWHDFISGGCAVDTATYR